MTPKAAQTKTAAYHHGDLRNAMIVEGRRALEQISARDLSLRSVARAVGVSEAAPSRHFKDKDGLLAAIAADGFKELATMRQVILAETTDSAQRVYQMMDSYVQFALKHKGLFDLMVGPHLVNPNEYEEYTQASVASFTAFSKSVCDYAREKGWPKEHVFMVEHAAWSVEHGLATLIIANRLPRPYRPLDPQDIISFSIKLLISAIDAGPKSFDRTTAQLAAGK